MAAAVSGGLTLKLCFVDESGGFEAEGSGPAATPLMVIAGLIVNHQDVRRLTTDFLRLKQTFYPGSKRMPHLLDNILVESKSTDVRSDIRSSARDARRRAIGYLDKIVSLLESTHARIIGRVWVKQVGAALAEVPTYTFAIQDIARHFDHLCESARRPGLMVLDGRRHRENRAVSHSIFTFKHRLAGDTLPHLVESPTFAVSDNHAGLQIADLVAGALVFPMACRVYCAGCTAAVHVHPNYDRVRERFAARVHNLEYLHADAAGRMRGGITVSDRRGGRPSSVLFQRP